MTQTASGTARADAARAHEERLSGRPPAPALRRELGRWDLTAIGVNQVIGGAVFAMPASVAALVGGWSPYLIVGVGIASLLIAATFAEVGSRFDLTGGPYLYTKAAFGRFLAFEIGWMQWFTRVASWASVINVLVASLGFYWPAVNGGLARTAVIAVIILALTVINVLGIRQSAWVVNGLTIGKLAPLALFVVVGMTAIDPSRLHAGPLPTSANLAASALLLIFAFGGYEVVPLPAGESRDPRRAVPFALITTVTVVAVVLALAQVVALGTLPNLSASKTPLAESSAIFMGAAGAAIVTFGAVLSTLGNNMGQALSGSRALFALAEQGDLPSVFGRLSTRFGTPVVAIVFTAAVSLVLATTGSFVTMAQVSAVSRLMVYVATCGAALRLRGRAFHDRVAPAVVRVPFGPLIPVAALVIALTILFAATGPQLRAGAYAVVVGAALFVLAARFGKRV